MAGWIDKASSEIEIVEPENINDWVYREDDDGTITLISYKGTDTTVVVPNYINGKRVKKIVTGKSSGIESLWAPEICSDQRIEYFLVQDTIKEVIISKGIESIITGGMYGSFTNSQALEKVVIPDSVKEIGITTFCRCTNLTNITIPASVTTMGEWAFLGIPSIVVNVPFKEGEIPEGWSVDWNKTDSNCTITVNYAK